MRPGRATPAGALAAVFQVLAARELACLCCCCCWEAAPQMNMRKTSSSLPPSSANTNCSSRGGSGRVECMHVQPCQACPAASGGNIKWLAGGSKGSPASDSSSQPQPTNTSSCTPVEPPHLFIQVAHCCFKLRDLPLWQPQSQQRGGGAVAGLAEVQQGDVPAGGVGNGLLGAQQRALPAGGGAQTKSAARACGGYCSWESKCLANAMTYQRGDSGVSRRCSMPTRSG